MRKDRAREAARRKVRARVGFSLFETMVTLLILSLMSGGVAAGVRFAAEQYRVSMIASESIVLCSTLSDKITDFLRNTDMNPKPSEAEFDANKPMFNLNNTTIRTIFARDGEIWVGDGEPETGSPSLSSNERLIPKSSYSSFNLKANLTQFSYDTDLKCFRVKLVIYDVVMQKDVLTTSFDVFPLN